MFGDRILCPAFQREAHDDFVDYMVLNECPCFYNTVIYAFQVAPENNLLLKFMVELQCYWFNENRDKRTKGELERRKDVPSEFWIKVMVRYSEIYSNDMPLVDPAEYYMHASIEGIDVCKAYKSGESK